MATIEVLPRQTPAERADAPVSVELDELVLRFEETDGIAKLVTCTSNGLDVELFHILTFT